MNDWSLAMGSVSMLMVSSDGDGVPEVFNNKSTHDLLIYLLNEVVWNHHYYHYHHLKTFCYPENGV